VCGGSKASGQKGGSSPSTSDAGRRHSLAKRNVQVKAPLRGRRFVLHTYLPVDVRPDAPLVLYASGAGGWHSFDGHVAEVLAESGIPVCGLSTHSYLKDFYSGPHPATPEEISADFAALVDQARAVACVDGARPVALVGWSLGNWASNYVRRRKDLLIPDQLTHPLHDLFKPLFHLRVVNLGEPLEVDCDVPPERTASTFPGSRDGRLVGIRRGRTPS
jgi:hypothetical protein